MQLLGRYKRTNNMDLNKARGINQGCLGMVSDPSEFVIGNQKNVEIRNIGIRNKFRKYRVRFTRIRPGGNGALLNGVHLTR